MSSEQDSKIFLERCETVGDIEQLTREAYLSPEMRKKVKKTLKMVNSTRFVPLRLVEIVSATKQAVNGVKYNFALKLRESGSKEAMDYSLSICEQQGSKNNVEISLTYKKPKRKC